MSKELTFSVLFGGDIQLNTSPVANQIDSLAEAETEFTRMVRAGHKVVKIIQSRVVREYDFNKLDKEESMT